VAPAAWALEDDVEAASTAWKLEPFWSRLTRVAVGVAPFMNVSQFCAMVAAAPVNVDEGVALAAGEAGALVAAAGEDVVAEAVGVTVLLELLELLEQAVIVAASARPSAGTSRPRRTV
jgi:hypothetical protein